MDAFLFFLYVSFSSFVSYSFVLYFCFVLFAYQTKDGQVVPRHEVVVGVEPEPARLSEVPNGHVGGPARQVNVHLNRGLFGV